LTGPTLVRPSSVGSTDVEAVLVVSAQLEGDMSIAAGRTRTSGTWVAQPESWTSGLHVVWSESWAPHETRLKSLMSGPHVAWSESWVLWGATKVVGTSRGAAEVGEAGDDVVAEGHVV
jgi:hypothetical protein